MVQIDQKTAKIIKKAQLAKNLDTQSKALTGLWGIVGDSIVNSMLQKDYQLISDFSMIGEPTSVRRANLSGKAFLVFRNAVMTFDPELGIPFLAYVAQKVNWMLTSEKRINSKHSSRETVYNNISDVFQNKDSDDVEADCFRKDAILAIKRIANKERKLAAYFNACQKVCDAGLDCTDAEVARHMDCTRASTGLYRKKLVRLLAEKGLDFESLVTVAP